MMNFYKLLFLFSFFVQSALATELTKVAIMDTGLDITDVRFKDVLCKEGHHDFTGEGLNDIDSHGTHVAGLIKENAKSTNYCLIILKYFTNKHPDNNYEYYINALRETVKLHVAYVNISGGGSGNRIEEENIFKDNPQITFVVAAGNDGKELSVSDFYPAAYTKYSNIISVGNMGDDDIPALGSNFGPLVKAWEYGENVLSYIPNGKMGYKSGTSMSTAVHTGKMLK